MQNSTAIRKRGSHPLLTVLGLAVFLLSLAPGCFAAQNNVAVSRQPLLAMASLPLLASGQTKQFSAPATGKAALADQEDDDATVAALAALAPTASATDGKPRNSEDEEADDDRFSRHLIGPLHDPLFVPAASDNDSLTSSVALVNDQQDPLFTGELEPLNVEEIALPGPNDFGTLDGELVDTSKLEDLTAFSDPDVQYDLPVVVNEQVKFFIDQYQTSLRKIFARWLARSGRFLPLIQEELAKAGLPQDLCYLPMIESGYRVNALSPAKAVGAWQFIQSTGKLYGLTVNRDIDERCDPLKSTRAAIHFLADLYEDFQSWPLAIAAYNAGGGRIRSAVDKTGSNDFWDLAKSKYLVSETKYYVPKLLAAIIVAKNPERYGFSDIDYEEPLAFETVRVPKSTHLEAVAMAAGTNLEDIYSLNRQLRRAMTPADPRFCELCVPIGTSELINQNLPLIKATYTTKFKTHVVKKKETAARISKMYGISQKTLLKINRLRVAKLPPGLRLQIPYQVKSFQMVSRPADHRLASVVPAATNPPEKTTLEPIHHKIRAGESLYQISRRYNVSLEKISLWNKQLDPKRLTIGQIIDIYPDERLAAAGKDSDA